VIDWFWRRIDRAVELLIRHGGVEKREGKITVKSAKKTQRIIPPHLSG